METPFYGRSDELERLRLLLQKRSASLVVIKGRRRIGKSRLIQEFGKGLNTYLFTGLPPTKETTAQTQRDYFAKQLEQLVGLRGIKTEDWSDLFWDLAKETSQGRVLIVLDEVNWMGSFDDTFLGKLKSAWDLHFKNNPQLMLILSGSMTSWIEENILSSTGFMGRTSLELTLDELPLHICNLFWRKNAKSISAYEKFKILSVTGGMPRYLEEINPHLSAEENIHNLGFRKGSLLVVEFERIFSDLFSKRSSRYKQIVERLVDGSATLEQICDSVQLEKSGSVSKYLEDLEETGFIKKDYTWNIKTGKESTLCKFRLRDNYVRFYLKYIEPHLSKIEKDIMAAPPAWSSIMGIQFENLVINNVRRIYEFLRLDMGEIIYDNPYFQRATKAHPGCQVDYLIQSKFNTIYICEIKFYKEPIGTSIIKEVQEKMDRLIVPKNFSIRPVLIHVNGVTDGVIESEFFASIIDFGSFLELS